jgi:hypothetical protein
VLLIKYILIYMQPSIERKLNFSPLRIQGNFTFEE